MVDLTDLPQTVLYQICNYLSFQEVLVLSNICESFHLWLNRNLFWKRRLEQFYGKYPCYNDEKIDWRSLSLKYHTFSKTFGAFDENICFRKYYSNAVGQGIDALHIPTKYPDILLVGDRGRVLSLFSFKNISNKEIWKPSFYESKTHLGWIWTINSCYDNIITGSWDGVLRVWTLSESGLLPQSRHKLESPVLCSSFLDSNILAVGTNNRGVLLIDLRSPTEHSIPAQIRHKKAVLCMDAVFETNLRPTQIYDSKLNLENQLSRDFSESSEYSSIAASEDFSNLSFDAPIFDSLADVERLANESEKFEPPLCVNANNCDETTNISIDFITGSIDQFLYGWDLRNVSIPVIKYQLSRYPRKMSLSDRNRLWVAEPPNKIHIFNLGNDQFDPMHKNEIPGWNRGFGGLKAVDGCLFACGVHGSVEAFYSTYPLKPFAQMSLAENISSLPTSLEYNNEILVVGSGNGSVYLWSTKSKMLELSDL